MDPSVEELCNSLANVEYNSCNMMELGRMAIELKDDAGLIRSIMAGAHLEELVTTAIRCNNQHHVNILVDHGANIYPEDFLHPMTDAMREYLSYCYANQ